MYDFVMATADVVALLSLPALLMFVVRYAGWSNWRVNPVGKALMWAVASLVLVLLLVVATRVVTEFYGPMWPLRPWLRLGAYILVTGASWRLLWILLRIQSGERVEAAEEEESRR